MLYQCYSKLEWYQCYSKLEWKPSKAQKLLIASMHAWNILPSPSSPNAICRHLVCSLSDSFCSKNQKWIALLFKKLKNQTSQYNFLYVLKLTTFSQFVEFYWQQGCTTTVCVTRTPPIPPTFWISSLSSLSLSPLFSGTFLLTMHNI